MNIDFSLLEDINLPEPSPQEEADTLLTLQTRRVELLGQRDELAQKRLQLKESIDRLNLTLDNYKDQQAQYETKQKLEFYLHQNDHEFLQLSAPDDAAQFVLDNLDVLPSSDWTKRLELVNMFYPNMQVTDLDVLTSHEDDLLVTTFEYVLAAKGLPSLNVKVVVRDETVLRVELGDFARTEHLLQKISPSYCKTLAANYRRHGKIDLVMHSFHNLATLQQRRIACFAEILRSWSAHVSRPGPTWTQDAHAALLALPYIELAISKDGTGFKVRLHWDLAIDNAATGTVQSQLRFAVVRADGTFLDDAQRVFMTLVPQHGVVKAFLFMLANVFDMH